MSHRNIIIYLALHIVHFTQLLVLRLRHFLFRSRLQTIKHTLQLPERPKFALLALCHLTIEIVHKSRFLVQKSKAPETHPIVMYPYEFEYSYYNYVYVLDFYILLISISIFRICAWDMAEYSSSLSSKSVSSRCTNSFFLLRASPKYCSTSLISFFSSWHLIVRKIVRHS